MTFGLLAYNKFFFFCKLFALIVDYKASKPVEQFLGSINDEKLLREACRGVHCVMHIASLIDVSMFPNMDTLERVNVQGWFPAGTSS